MLCPVCNRPVAEGARFCGSCGAAVDMEGGPEKATLIRRAPAAAGPSGSASASANTAGSAYEPAGRSQGSAAPPLNEAALLPRLLGRIKNILLTPRAEWAVIESEPTSIADLYKGYVAPLAALAAVMSFLRLSVIGISTPFGGAFRTPLASGLVYALVSFVLGLVMLYLVGLIINGLAPTFSGTRNQRQAMKTAAYAFTPAWVGSVLGLLPALAILLQLIAGLYGIYLLYLGLPQLMKSPREKAVGYTASVIICVILMGIVLGVLSSAVGGFGGYGRFGAMHDSGLSTEEEQARAAAAVGSMVGAAMGTDEKGKQGLGAALNSLAQAGQRMEQENAARTAMAPAPSSSIPSATPADNPQNAAAATAGLLTALGGAMGGAHRVDPIDFHTLKGMLPESLPGMQRTGAEGSSQQAMGVKGSSAVANYQGPAGARAEIKIADVSGVSGLLDVAGSLAQAPTSESDTGYEKDTVVGGRTVHEKYDGRSNHGEISVIVAKRFAVEVSGDGVPMSTLEQYAGNVDYGRLESMKDQGAHP